MNPSSPPRPPMNPYAPPQTVIAPFAHNDSTDIYEHTLPTPGIRAASMAGIMTAIACLFMSLRVFMGTTNYLPLLILGGLLAGAGLFMFLIVWGISRGNGFLLVCGFVGCPLIALASLFVLLNGSLAGFVTGFTTLIFFILLAISASPIRKIGVARAALAKQLEIERRAIADR